MIWLARMFFDKLLGGNTKLFDKRPGEVGLAVEPYSVGKFCNRPIIGQQ